MIKNWIEEEFFQLIQGILKVTPLDKYCNSLKISLQINGLCYEEFLSIADVIDIKSLLKNGKKINQINKMSILFLKLIISQSLAHKKIEIRQVQNFPWRKIIRGQKNINQLIQKSQIIKQPKGVLLRVNQDLLIILPLRITNIQTKAKITPQTRQQQIKRSILSYPK